MEGDRELIRIVDAAMAEAARKSGPWLVCRPGCYDCCIGPFPIDQLDAARLRRGLAELERSDPARAQRVRERARRAVDTLMRDHPEETLSRVLAEDGIAEDDLCPALDPETGTCDLYSARPLTCRTFGPPIHFKGEALAVCDLCYRGATNEEIAGCAVEIDSPALDGDGETIVAFALIASEPTG